jgi:hypothetical protein
MLDARELLVEGPAAPARTVVLAHGAGAPMDSPFLSDVAAGLARRGLGVVRFEFPYMKRRRESGRGGPPDPGPVLEARWLAVLAHLGDARRLVIGGKSLGGRIASMIADRAGVAGLVCLGYPFHPPNRPDRPRTTHLRTLSTPALIVQGTRDPFGLPEEIAAYDLSPAIRVEFIPDGDHSLRPRVASGRTEAQNLEAAVTAVAAFALEGGSPRP